jgi:hypothetical protein
MMMLINIPNLRTRCKFFGTKNLVLSTGGQGIGVYLHVPGSYQILEDFLTTKVEKVK